MRLRGSAPLAAVVLLGLVGCTAGGGAPRQRHAAPTTASAAHPTASRRPSPSILPDVSWCAGPNDPTSIPNPSGPAYAGQGPHRVVVGEFRAPTAQDADDLDYTVSGKKYSLPASWVSFESDHLLQDPSHAQLIVCLTGIRKTDTKAIGTCPHHSLDGKVYPVAYTYEVFEARTGRRVTRTTMAGDDTIDASCRDAGQYVVGQGPAPAAQALKDETFRSWLRPLVLGPAR